MPMSVNPQRAAQIMLVLLIGLLGLTAAKPSFAQNGLDPSPPTNMVKLIFIHHSTGENWLMDGYGDLGRVLQENNYFVSDTNYGWGPNAVGDTTDIPDWLRWFRSSETPEIMAAIFSENRINSGDWSYFERYLSEPGGENEVIMFKSCFPNSELDGSPNDSPGTYADYTVAGAKYVYNEILQYFSSRPDKLFVVITAPPVSDSTLAENARAFNNWLMSEWLVDYEGNNVVIFDFYNVLTGRDHHHRLVDGQVEHTYREGADTLAYPSDDDHPSAEGSRKATEEFVPLLNAWYKRWKAGAPTSPPIESETLPPSEGEESDGEEQGEVVMSVPLPDGVVDDFEHGNPAATGGWSAYFDQIGKTTLQCGIASDEKHAGSNALKIEFTIDVGAWASCELYYQSMQDYSGGDGISFYLHANKPGIPYDLMFTTSNVDNPRFYGVSLQTTDASVNGWDLVQVGWGQLLADWEEGGPAFDSGNVISILFAVQGYDGAHNGVIWVDEIQLTGNVPQEVEEAESGEDTTAPQAADQAEGQSDENDGSVGDSARCGSAPAFSLLLLVGLAWARKRK
jgi:hypothetical protein